MDPLTQTFNPSVQGSNPCRPTSSQARKRPVRLACGAFMGTFYLPVRSSLYLPTVSINFRPKCVPLSLTVYTRRAGRTWFGRPLFPFVDHTNVVPVNLASHHRSVNDADLTASTSHIQ